MIGDSFSENQYNELDYCYTCEPYAPVPDIIKAYIPTLMPLIGLQSPSGSTIKLDNGLLKNDPACKPNVGSVGIQNYISIPKGKGYTYPGAVPKGHRFVTMIPFKEFDNKYFIAHG